MSWGERGGDLTRVVRGRVVYRLFASLGVKKCTESKE